MINIENLLPVHARVFVIIKILEGITVNDRYNVPNSVTRWFVEFVLPNEPYLIPSPSMHHFKVYNFRTRAGALV